MRTKLVICNFSASNSSSFRFVKTFVKGSKKNWIFEDCLQFDDIYNLDLLDKPFYDSDKKNLVPNAQIMLTDNASEIKGPVMQKISSR